MTAPVISFNGDDVIDVLVGESFVLPADFATLSDNFENATYLETQLTISGTDSVNTETEGNYTILYSVSDSSGNTGTKELIVRVSPPVHVISGVALDGYLSASAVTFTSVSGNFTKVTTTDANGSFQLEFSGDEFNATDSNANGLLDAQEGFIIVRGGIDGTTNETFGASLAADANSTVVTPSLPSSTLLFKKACPRPKPNPPCLFPLAIRTKSISRITIRLERRAKVTKTPNKFLRVEA